MVPGGDRGNLFEETLSRRLNKPHYGYVLWLGYVLRLRYVLWLLSRRTDMPSNRSPHDYSTAYHDNPVVYSPSLAQCVSRLPAFRFGSTTISSEYNSCDF